MSVPTVEVHLFAAARAAVGSPQVTLTAATLADVCTSLEAQFPEFRKVRPQCSFLLDESAVHGDLASVTLAPGARIDVLPPFAGGAL